MRNSVYPDQLASLLSKEGIEYAQWAECAKL